MSRYKVFLVVTALMFTLSTWLSAGSFLKTANQANEKGKAERFEEPQRTSGNDASEGSESEGNQGRSEREKDSPNDRDKGRGNDGKEEPGFQGKPPLDPDEPLSNPEVDEKGDQSPAKVRNHSAKDLMKLIFGKFQIKIGGGCIGEGPEKGGYLWTQKDLWEIYRTLYTLPKFFLTKNLEIRRVRIADNNSGLLGFIATGTRSLNVCDGALRSGLFGEVVVREMARSFVTARELEELRLRWMKLFWHGDGRTLGGKPPAGCSCGNPQEDFSESVKLFWRDGKSFKEKDHARYEFIKTFVMKGREFRRNNRSGCQGNFGKPHETPKPPEPPKTKPVEPVKPPERAKGGDRGASGKPDENSKNKPNNANTAKNGSISSNQKGQTKANIPPANKGGGDHGASGKPDENSKNKINNASTAKNGSSSSNQNIQTKINVPPPNKGGGDHGASGKFDGNSKNKPENASTANNSHSGNK